MHKRKNLKKYAKKTRVFHPIETLLHSWLLENTHRFTHKPKRIDKRSFSFEGIIENITLVFDYNLPEAMLCYSDENGELFDMQTIAYIGHECYDSQNGYYDADRVDGIYDYFPTQKELYIHNVFEYIIKYCNESFIEENTLYMYRYKGIDAGVIGNKKEEIKIQKLKEKYTLTTDEASFECKIYKYPIFKNRGLEVEEIILR